MIAIEHLKAIFFDLDNVLVFSEVLHFQAWQLVLKKVGISPWQLDFQQFIGIAEFTQAKLLKEKFSLMITPEKLCEHKRQVFIQLIQNGFDYPAGRNELIKEMSVDFTLGVVSSSARNIVQHVLATQELLPYFNFVISFEDCEKHKPDPMPYQQALLKADLLPHEALVIEDSISGILAAQEAGISVIGILKDQSPEQILKGVPYFNNFIEVREWLISGRTMAELKIG